MSAPTEPSDLLFAILGVQLGYLSADDVLAAGREVGSKQSLCEFLVGRGILDRARAQVLDRLVAKAATVSGGDANETLQLLPSAVRELKRASARTAPGAAAAVPPHVGVVDEQGHRYFASPRADAPPQELGRGGFGRVVVMHDTVIGRDVAWKQALVPGPESDALLAGQARMLAKLDHPAVVPVFELGRAGNGALYVASRRVAGQSLAEALTSASGLEQRLSLLPAVHTVARCLVHAHERGVTHRRMMPEHVSVGRLGEVYVHGWGWPDPDMSEKTAHELDLKALGALLHEVLTGLPVPVMGMVSTRGAPDDLVDLCRATLAGRVPTAEQFANELKAWLDGRRLAGYRYSSFQLLRRWVQRHRAYTAMLVTGVVLVAALAGTSAMRVREERDRARLFARRFLDDVALRLRAQPGVEPLLEQVTGAALSHYQRTTDLRSAPREERLRVARAMAKLGVVSQSLGRVDEAQRSLDFADVLALELAREATDAEARVVLAQTAAARALLRGSTVDEAQRFARQSRAFADEAVKLAPDRFEARLAAAEARLLLASDDGAPPDVLDRLGEAVSLLQTPSSNPLDEVARAQALSSALLTGLEWRARSAQPPGEVEARTVAREIEALRLRTPDDLELQLAVVRVGLLLSEAIEERSAEEARVEAANAARLADEVLERRPDRADVARLAVRATLRAGRAKEALTLAQRLAPNVEGLASIEAEAAFFAGEFETARTTVVKSPGARDVLVRALSAAALGRSSDAVIQARALKASVGEVRWPKVRLAAAVEGMSGVDDGVKRFAIAWRDAGPDAALAEWIAELEGKLGR
jgi:hypothetical protein